ncbi:hypothetical protein Hanom_Chr04g00344351 [Helianthus anomalus]
MEYTGSRNAGGSPEFNDENGDHPRPFPFIKELKDASDVTERKGSPSWDYDVRLCNLHFL